MHISTQFRCFIFVFLSFLITSISSFAKTENSYLPAEYLKTKLNWFKEELKNRSDNNLKLPAQIETRATRNEWLKKIYETQILDANEFTLLLADKLFFSAITFDVLGPKAFEYIPKTMGLKDFLLKHKLIDKSYRIVATKEQILMALKKEFPVGNIVKPAAGMNSEGKGKGFYFKNEKFVTDLLDTNSGLYNPIEFKTPHTSSMLGKPSSGEYLILQENVISAAGIIEPLKVKELKEVRIHTFEGQVLSNASYSRWKEIVLNENELQKAAKFVQNFLDQLPPGFTERLAMSLDVALMDNGVMKIIDVNTNRGRKGQWSGFLVRPEVLGAYTRQIEKEKNIQFAGMNGLMLRNDWGNYFKYLKKYYIEGIR